MYMKLELSHEIVQKSQNVEIEEMKSSLKLWIENQHEENISVLRYKDMLMRIQLATTLILSKLQSFDTMKYHIAINNICRYQKYLCEVLVTEKSISQDCIYVLLKTS